MRTYTVMIVVLALLFGTTAAVGVYRLRSHGKEETVDVVVPTKDMPRFTTVTPDLVKVRKFPKSLAPAGAANRVEDVQNRVTDTRLVAGEPVLEARLAPKGLGRGMAAVIPNGMRAVTIRTPNIASGVAGFVLPGHKVDVLFTWRAYQLNDPSGGGLTRVLLSNVEVLAVDQKIEAPTESKANEKDLRSVTLLVTPEQAAELELAQTAGTLYLALRNQMDPGTSPSGVTTLNNLRYELSAVAPSPQPVAPRPEPPKPEPPAVVVAPDPRAVPERTPPQPPRIRTLRGGVPGQVIIE